MPLKQHRFYVYYSGADVLAREGDRDPIVAETLDSPQDAHDRVQSIVNPEGRRPADFGPLGFNDPAFQDAISGNCEEYVRRAYSAAGVELDD